MWLLFTFSCAELENKKVVVFGTSITVVGQWKAEVPYTIRLSPVKDKFGQTLSIDFCKEGDCSLLYAIASFLIATQNIRM